MKINGEKGSLNLTKEKTPSMFFIFFYNKMYVPLNPPALPGYQVLVGAIGCLEQTNSLENLKIGTPTWSPQGHLKIKFIQL